MSEGEQIWHSSDFIIEIGRKICYYEYRKVWVYPYENTNNSAITWSWEYIRPLAKLNRAVKFAELKKNRERSTFCDCDRILGEKELS